MASAPAEQLLAAQVAWVLAELAPDRLAELVARDIDDLLDIATRLTVADVADPDAIKQVGRRLIRQVSPSSVIADLSGAFADGIYDMSAGEQYLLGDVLDRDAVLALVQHVLTLRTLSDRALDRLTESPLVATIAARFVAKIVGDFMQQNRARAEKLPGMSTMLNIGSGAVSKVRGATDRHVEQLLGDAAGKGAMYALKRTNNAIRELLHDAPIEQAAMQLWDLHADEPISDLRRYLSRAQLREFVLRLHAVIVGARDTDFAAELVDVVVDVFFEQYGQYDVARLITELGITRDDLVADAVALLEPLVSAVRADGTLERLVRSRLEPFFRSDAVTAILDR